MKPFEPLVMKTNYEQRKRFFGSSLWKDIEATVENYRRRELEAMAAPERFNEEQTTVDRFRGRIDVLGGICATLRMCMFDDIETQLNEGEEENA